MLVGRNLGAGDAVGAYDASRRMVTLAGGLGCVLALLLLAGSTLIPRAFTSDRAVLDEAAAL